MKAPSSGIYRKEAIAYHSASQSDGEVLLMVPGWVSWTYRLLLGVLVGVGVFTLFATVSQYAEGPAVIRAEDRVVVTSSQSGIVESVRAVPGARVERGDLLVRLRAGDEEAQIASVQREFESNLVRMLVNPMDQTSRQALAGLRARRELLDAQLAQRIIVAPAPGLVGDVRVKPGQSIAPGELITSLSSDRGRYSVLVFLPGQHRPELREGQPLRLEITGYPYAYQDLSIERVDSEIVGPYEVRRMIGPEVADAVAVSGPVVVVHAAAKDAGFVSGGQVHRYFDGMHAVARVRLRSDRLITTIVPALKMLPEPGR